MKANNDAKHINKYVRKLRRYFHMYPELSNQESETSKKVIMELKELKVDYEVLDNYSIVAMINEKNKNKVLAFRCELDALPIVESGACEYPSTIENVSHMCGHDLHLAIMLGVIKTLKYREKELNGCIKFIFEANTEHYDGANAILNSGLLDDVDYIFSLHNLPEIPTGSVTIADGIQLIGGDIVKIEWSGESSHSSLPSNAKDAILAAANFTDNIQSVLKKAIDPYELVIASVTKFLGGIAQNVISEHCEIVLNLRYREMPTRQKIHKILKEYMQMVAKQFQVQADYQIIASALPVINSHEVVTKVIKSLRNKDLSITLCNTAPALQCDNFSNYLKKIKGTYVLFGVGKPHSTIYSNHSDKYYADEDSLYYATALYLQIAYDELTVKNT